MIQKPLARVWAAEMLQVFSVVHHDAASDSPSSAAQTAALCTMLPPELSPARKHDCSGRNQGDKDMLIQWNPVPISCSWLHHHTDTGSDSLEHAWSWLIRLQHFTSLQASCTWHHKLHCWPIYQHIHCSYAIHWYRNRHHLSIQKLIKMPVESPVCPRVWNWISAPRCLMVQCPDCDTQIQCVVAREDLQRFSSLRSLSAKQ